MADPRVFVTRRRYTPTGAVSFPEGGGPLAAGFRSASYIRQHGTTTGGSHDYHALYDRPTMIHQSRAFDRDNVLYSALLDRAVNAICGPAGFAFDLNTPSRRVNESAKELFANWSRDPEVRGLFDWPALQKLVLREVLAAGDVLNVKIRSQMRLQVIEAERVRGGSEEYLAGNGAHGVRQTEWGRPRAFGVGDYHPGGGSIDRGKVDWVPAENCIFVYNIRKRAGQSRGLPALQESFSNFHRMNDILDAEATAWDRLSRFAVAVLKKDAEGLARQLSDDDDDKSGDDTDGHLTDRVTYVDQGTVFWGEKDEDVKGIEQNRPNQHFYEAVKTFLRLISMAIGVPVEYVLFDFEKSNFSQSRATLTLAYYIFREWQQLMIRLFHRRVWAWLAGSWVARGLLVIPKSMAFNELLHAQKWHTPAFPWVDPLKEAQAWEKQLAVNLATHAQAIAAQGRDRDEQNDRREEEIRDAIERAKRLTEETGEQIDWRMFAGLDTGKTERAAKVKKGEPLKVEVDDDDDDQGDDDA